MRTHFHHEMEELQQAILELGEHVCRNVEQAVLALYKADLTMAAKVMRADREVDRRDVSNEESCLKIIALHQPVADDLRLLIVILKVNHELERISDLAVDIAAAVHSVGDLAENVLVGRLKQMAEQLPTRLHQALTALFKRDAEGAREVWLKDEEIDAATQHMQQLIRNASADSSVDRGSLFALFTAIAQIERLADHIKNIAKDVIYLVLGEIARHRSDDFLCSEDDHSAPIRVLFVCIHNSARSQMAEAWMNHLYAPRLQAESAGLEPGILNPIAIEVMQEVGIDISQNATNDVFEIIKSGRRFDYLITVCDDTNAGKCPPAPGGCQEFHWTFPDPATATGSVEEKMQYVRNIRDLIREHIDAWVGHVIATSHSE